MLVRFRDNQGERSHNFAALASRHLLPADRTRGKRYIHKTFTRKLNHEKDTSEAAKPTR